MLGTAPVTDQTPWKSDLEGADEIKRMFPRTDEEKNRNERKTRRPRPKSMNFELLRKGKSDWDDVDLNAPMTVPKKKSSQPKTPQNAPLKESENELQDLRKEIEELKEQLALLTGKKPSSSAPSSSKASTTSSPPAPSPHLKQKKNCREKTCAKKTATKKHEFRYEKL